MSRERPSAARQGNGPQPPGPPGSNVPAVVKVLERTTVKQQRPFRVLLAVALFADSDGTHAWPTEATIAKYARMSKRNAQRGIGELIAAGELAVDYKAGPGGHNLYRVLCCAPDVDIAVSTSPHAARGQLGPYTWTPRAGTWTDRASHVDIAVSPNHPYQSFKPSTTREKDSSRNGNDPEDATSPLVGAQESETPPDNGSDDEWVDISAEVQKLKARLRSDR